MMELEMVTFLKIIVVILFYFNLLSFYSYMYSVDGIEARRMMSESFENFKFHVYKHGKFAFCLVSLI